MNISMSLALTMAGAPKPPSKTSSLKPTFSGIDRPQTACSKDISLYKGKSDRPLGWKPRKFSKNLALDSTLRGMTVKKWDGAARSSSSWDGLRRDPELWYPNGNCLVHLYGQGQSRRGPAFKVPMEGLLATNCRPLLERFLVETFEELPDSEFSDVDDGTYFKQHSTRMFELYIPAPATAERGEVFLYHTASRNLFAWIFGKSLVGVHLGGALVGLLNSMNEFRSIGEDNVQAIMDYMGEEGYGDMRSQPDHALAVLFFAEHFQFRDLWTDAFAHCTGMNENLISSPGFEFMSRASRALITRSRLEMDMRLDHCGRRLGSFLSDDLSDAHLGLPVGARAHLDKFRSFLQSHYIAKLGYYPPTSCDDRSAAFPKNIYGQMRNEFQELYQFLVDPQASDSTSVSQLGGICVLQSVQAFDQRHKYPSMLHQLPLLPETEEASPQRLNFNRRFSFAPKADKMKPDPRLVTFSSLSKATNRKDGSLLDCTLVRAYRGFEKDCVFNPSKVDKSDKLPQTEARKVRWILIYAVLQTLISATKAPVEVSDTQNVPYNICVLTAGCPPWKEQRPIETLLRTQTDQMKADFTESMNKANAESAATTPLVEMEIKPDIDYLALHQAQHQRVSSEPSVAMPLTKSTIKKALSTLGNMPELRHPKPQRNSYHEILVSGYGNGTNEVTIMAENTLRDKEHESHFRKLSSESGSSLEDMSSRWSHTDAATVDSPASSLSSNSRRGSDTSTGLSKTSIKHILDQPMSSLGLVRVPSSIYSESVYEESVPNPLQLKRASDFVKVTQEVKVEWEEEKNGKANDELLAYLDA